MHSTDSDSASQLHQELASSISRAFALENDAHGSGSGGGGNSTNRSRSSTHGTANGGSSSSSGASSNSASRSSTTVVAAGQEQEQALVPSSPSSSSPSSSGTGSSQAVLEAGAVEFQRSQAEALQSAREFLEQQRYEKAREHESALLESHPENQQAALVLTYALFGSGKRAVQEGKFESAMDLFEETTDTYRLLFSTVGSFQAHRRAQGVEAISRIRFLEILRGAIS